MVRHTAIEGQMASQSHEDRSLHGSWNSSLAGGGNPTPSRPLGSHAYSPSVEGWPGLLEELDVQFLILDRHHDAELLGLFQAHPLWAIDCQDEQSVLFVRTDLRPSVVSSRIRRCRDVQRAQ